MQIIPECQKFTGSKLSELQNALKPLANPRWSLIANGSYARQEATQLSDFDYYLLHKSSMSARELRELHTKVRRIVSKVIGKMPSSDGAFDTTLELGTLTRNIGGNDDTNKSITRRILLLTEGIAVGNPALLDAQRGQLIDRYIKDEISDHQLCLFLLNDLIRYYRTVCVDFEFKTVEANKSWGLRNIKLVFSRKLLYFSGVLMVAETAQRTASEKREIVKELIDLSPIERIQKVCGTSSERALRSYEIFLKSLNDEKTRRALEAVKSSERKTDELFKRLKNEGQHFSDHLMSALRSTYSESHPIHRAIVM